MRQTVNVIIHTIWPRVLAGMEEDLKVVSGDKVFMELIERKRRLEWNWHALSWIWKIYLPKERKKV